MGGYFYLDEEGAKQRNYYCLTNNIYLRKNMKVPVTRLRIPKPKDHKNITNATYSKGDVPFFIRVVKHISTVIMIVTIPKKTEKSII